MNETGVKSDVPTGNLMDPYQASECLKAAARLMTSALKCHAYGRYGIQTDMIQRALDILAMIPRDVEQYIHAVMSGNEKRDQA